MTRYFLKNKKEKDGLWIGDLYRQDNALNFILVEKEYQLTLKSDRDVRFSIIVQKVAEGHSLKTVLESPFTSWTPSFYEFLMWVDGNKFYKKAFHKAKVLRSQGVIENLFQQVEKSAKSLDAEDMERSLSILKQISRALEKEVDDDDVDLIDLHVVDVDHIGEIGK